ncbi:MAG: DNA-binding protein [Mogibacterium sp.]|nr:DNA-binding protein [Mogibacterium sp.]
MNKTILGIDTSNYKTSVAVTDAERRILFERSEFLEVEQGERGLRQSVAFFRHSNVLPLFIEEAFRETDPSRIAAVAVSDRPRCVEGSYMPVFLSGVHAARMIAASLKVPVYRFSHQEGHIEAILLGMEDVPEEFLQFHLSGGTTECLRCCREGCHFRTEILGGTQDISIGQLLDRVGVCLGYPFPAGKYLDEIASRTELTAPVRRIRCREGRFNLSGPESEAMRRIERIRTERGEVLCPETDQLVAELFERISLLLYDAACQCSKVTGIRTVMMAGGVASSRTVRNRLTQLCSDRNAPEIRWGDPRLSGDNAVGISLLGGLALKEEHETGNRNSDQ